LGRVLQWAFPIAAVVGAVAYSLIQTSTSDESEPTATTPSYQLPPAALSAGQKQPIHVDDAFKLTMSADSSGVINARFDIESNYYLYRDKIKVTGPDGSLLSPSFPASKTKRDQHFGDSEVFDQSFAFTVAANSATEGSFSVSATYQGCENEGICYPPVTKQFSVEVAAAQ
jgi:thiol:disulfide interchange protein DsbD